MINANGSFSINVQHFTITFSFLFRNQLHFIPALCFHFLLYQILKKIIVNIFEEISQKE
jgi:hypothetical protein